MNNYRNWGNKVLDKRKTNTGDFLWVYNIPQAVFWVTLPIIPGVDAYRAV